MKRIPIDETKLPAAMALIEQAAELMAEQPWGPALPPNLAALQAQLRDLAGNPQLRIQDFQRYWSYTTLETMARKALMAPPVRDETLSDGQIRQIVASILSLPQAEMDWWLRYLKLNTGLDNLTDYIFYPDMVGLAPNATLKEIGEQIVKDAKRPAKPADTQEGGLLDGI